MSKVLVTGGAGFVGSHLVDRLVKDGREVLVLDNLSTGKEENINKSAQFIRSDVSDYDQIKDLFDGVEVVFHCAALARITPSVKDPLSVHKSNATGTLNVLWAAKNAGVKKVIYSGSSSAYGNYSDKNEAVKESSPTQVASPYALSKLIGEQYCQLFSKLYDLPTVILRYFNVYGPRQITEGAYATVIGIFLKQREEGKPMTVVADAGERRRDFTHIEDIVEGNVLAWQNDVPPGEIINLGRGQNYSINEVAKMIGGDTTTIAARPWEYESTLADNSKAKKILGWDPKISLEDGIKELKKLHGLS